MRSIKGARLFGILLLAAFAVIVMAWYVTVTSEQERYLTGRNFRILTTIAHELDSSIDTQGRTFGSLLKSRLGPGEGAAELKARLAAARPFIPSLNAVDSERPLQAFSPDDGNPTDDNPRQYTNVNRTVLDGDRAWLQLTITRSGRDTSENRDVWLRLGSLLSPIFEPKLRDGAFDTLLLAAIDGSVLHVDGVRRDVLTLTSLDRLAPVNRTLLSFGGQPAASAPGFGSVARTTGVVDVVIAGTEYRLFTHPCCLTTPVQIAADGTTIHAPGLVVVGLIPASEFRSKARQIPPTVVIACIAGILLVLAGWPFLKLKLIGERQRVRRLDVVQVIACGLFGVALLTIVCLDVYAYRHLNDTRDDQLQQLAGALSKNVATELTAAFGQLRELQTLAVTCGATVKTDRTMFSPDSKVADCARAAGLTPSPPSYPHFKTVAFIDGKGNQSVKWTSRTWLPSPIDVGGRAYFTEPLVGRVWPPPSAAAVVAEAVLPPCEPGYFLESIWSWTTSEPEAVLSSPTCDALPVGALTISMSSLIEPVLPPGFEFAVISESGDVLFHSDPQRNTHENLFRETDQNSRLRAAVASHSSEGVDLRYAGRSYRGFVRRMEAGTPWTIVTLSNNEFAWALHSEWLVLTLVALLSYLVVLVAIFGLCFFTGHADWLWADPWQVDRYQTLSVTMMALLAVAAGVLYFVGDNALLIAISFLMPLAAWLVCYLVLRRERAAEKEPRDAYTEYMSLAVLLFLLTAVFPAAGFFTAAYRMQVRTDVKYVQLELARASALREERLRRLQKDVPGVNVRAAMAPAGVAYDVYGSFLYGTRVTDADAADTAAAPRDGSGRHASDTVENIIEEYVPYYSERSVQMRELLLHDAASDGAWVWSPDPKDGRLRLFFNGTGDRPATVVSSAPPQLLDGLLRGRAVEQGLWLVLSGVMVTGLAWAVMYFIETRICLRGVDQPFPRRTPLSSGSGDRLFVVCKEGDREELTAGTFPLPFEKLATEQDLERTLMELDRTAPTLPVLVADFDGQLQDSRRARRCLAYVERLAADQARSVIILSSANRAAAEHAFRDSFPGGAIDARPLERWRQVAATFVAIDLSGPTPDKNKNKDQDRASLWSDLREVVPAAFAGGASVAMSQVLDRRRVRLVRTTLHAEADDADAFVRAVCLSIEQGLSDGPGDGRPPAQPRLRPSFHQVLDEVADRSEAWYRRIWRSCTPDERLVLAEVAAEGLVNHKSRLTVRRLLGRGLIAKDPSFRVMNTTFQRFVLSSFCQADVQAIEGTVAPSPWDRLRIPFFAVLLAAALFFLLTQRELFTATLAALTTLTAALPTLARLVSVMSGKRSEIDAKA